MNTCLTCDKKIFTVAREGLCFDCLMRKLQPNWLPASRYKKIHKDLLHTVVNAAIRARVAVHREKSYGEVRIAEQLLDDAINALKKFQDEHKLDKPKNVQEN